VYSILEIIISWVIVLATFPLHNLDNYRTPIVIAFGVSMGIANILYGISVPSIGLSLASSINPALAMTIGTILPLLIFNKHTFATLAGVLLLIGLAIGLIALFTVTIAGLRRDKEQKGTELTEHEPFVQNEGKVDESKTAKSEFIKGLIACMLSGVFAPLANVGFVFGAQIMQPLQIPAIVKSIAIWWLILTPMNLISIVYSLVVLHRNNSLQHYRISSFGFSSLINYFGAVLLAIMQFGAFVLYGLATEFLETLGTSAGFAIFNMSMIMTGIVWGIILGDWKNSTLKTRLIMVTGVVILSACIAIMTVGLKVQK